MRQKEDANVYYFQKDYKSPYFPERDEQAAMRNRPKNNARQSKRKQLVKISYSNDQYFPQANRRIYTESSANNSSSNNNSRKKFILNASSRNSSFNRSGNRSNPLSQNSSRQSAGYRSDLSREITRLNAKIMSKEKELMAKEMCSAEKQKDNEIIELYRVVHYYEGKTQQMESQLKKYEKALLKLGSECDQKTKNKTSLEELIGMFEEMRTKNEEYLGTIEEKNYDIGMLTDKLRKSQLKIGFLSKFSLRKNDSKILNKEQSKFNQSKTLSKQTLHEALNNHKSYGNIQSKLNSIELNLKYLQKKNDKLIKQIEEKDKKIHEYEKELNINNQNQQEGQSEKSGRQSMKVESTQVGTTSVGLSRHSRMNRRVKNQEQILQQQRKSSNSFAKQVTQKKGIYKKDDPLNKVIFLPKNMLNPIQRPQNKLSLKPIFFQKKQIVKEQEYVEIEKNLISQESNISSPKQTKTEQPLQKKTELQQLLTMLSQKSKPKIFRKLRLQLMTEEISHQDAISKLIDEDLEPETLEEDVYNLTADQSQWFVEYLSQARSEISNLLKRNSVLLQQKSEQEALEQIMIQLMKMIFPSYRDLTLKQQNNFKTHVYNQAMNRMDQFDEFLEQEKEQVEFQKFEEYFKSWGLLNTHIDVLMKAYYEKTRSLDRFCFEQAKNIIFSWGAF